MCARAGLPESAATEALRQCGFDEAMCGKRVDQLSGGWRMRVALAAALGLHLPLSANRDSITYLFGFLFSCLGGKNLDSDDSIRIGIGFDSVCDSVWDSVWDSIRFVIRFG